MSVKQQSNKADELHFKRLNWVSGFAEYNGVDSKEIETIKHDSKMNFSIFMYKEKEPIYDDKKYRVIGFLGRKQGPVLEYRFKDRFEMLETLQKEVDRVEKRYAEKQARKEAEKAAMQFKAMDVVNIGDVFHHSFGYDATYNKYYQVVGFKGNKSLHLRKICSERNETGYLSGMEKPIKDSFVDDEIITVRMTAKEKVKINSYSHAYLCSKNENGDYSSHFFNHNA